jgi:hypothetical protein
MSGGSFVLVHDRSAAEANVLNRRALVVAQMRVFIDGGMVRRVVLSFCLVGKIIVWLKKRMDLSDVCKLWSMVLDSSAHDYFMVNQLPIFH